MFEWNKSHHHPPIFRLHLFMYTYILYYIYSQCSQHGLFSQKSLTIHNINYNINKIATKPEKKIKINIKSVSSGRERTRLRLNPAHWTHNPSTNRHKSRENKTQTIFSPRREMDSVRRINQTTLCRIMNENKRERSNWPRAIGTAFSGNCHFRRENGHFLWNTSWRLYYEYFKRLRIANTLIV